MTIHKRDTVRLAPPFDKILNDFQKATPVTDPYVARLDAELDAQREAAIHDKGNWFRTGYMFGITRAKELYEQKEGK
jgi:hypothetical protein